MSVLIVGGNECMEGQYADLCKQYRCKAKVVTKSSGAVNVGSPDLVVLFTATMSHKMLRSVLSETKGKNVQIERCHSSSVSALRSILQTRVGAVGNV